VPANSLKNLFPATPAAPPPAAPPPGGAFNFGPPPARGGAEDVVEEIGVEALVDDEPYPRRRAPGGSSDLFPQLLMRILAWDVGATNVTRGEQQQLASHGVTGAAGQRYLAWRRAFLFVVALAALAAAVFIWIDVFEEKYFDGFGGVGSLSLILNMLAALALPGLALTAALLWSRPGLSRFLLLLGLAIGFLVPMLTNLLPFHWKIKSMPIEGMGGFDGPPSSGPGPSAAGAGGVVFVFLLLPYLLGLGAGWFRGGVRIKTLLPESVLPGWLVFAVVPLYLFLALFTIALFVQATPYLLVFLALVCLLLTPLAYFIPIGTLLRPAKKGLGRTALPIMEWIIFGLHCLGVLFLLILIIAEKPVRFRPVAHLYSQFLAATLYAVAVAADLILAATVSGWRNQSTLAKEGGAAEFDQMMAEVAPVVGR
jgi:hypothetical protein